MSAAHFFFICSYFPSLAVFSLFLLREMGQMNWLTHNRSMRNINFKLKWFIVVLFFIVVYISFVYVQFHFDFWINHWKWHVTAAVADAVWCGREKMSFLFQFIFVIFIVILSYRCSRCHRIIQESMEQSKSVHPDTTSLSTVKLLLIKKRINCEIYFFSFDFLLSVDPDTRAQHTNQQLKKRFLLYRLALLIPLLLPLWNCEFHQSIVQFYYGNFEMDIFEFMKKN